jgi:type I restriction enzyme S subunit
MSSEAVEYSLRSLCLLVVDCPHATPEWTDSGVIVLRNQNIKGGRLDLTSPSYTDEAHYQVVFEEPRQKKAILLSLEKLQWGRSAKSPQASNAVSASVRFCCDLIRIK